MVSNTSSKQFMPRPKDKAGCSVACENTLSNREPNAIPLFPQLSTHIALNLRFHNLSRFPLALSTLNSNPSQLTVNSHENQSRPRQIKTWRTQRRHLAHSA